MKILRESLQLKVFLGRKVNFASIESEILPPVYKSSMQTEFRGGLCNPSYWAVGAKDVKTRLGAVPEDGLNSVEGLQLPNGPRGRGVGSHIFLPV